MSVSSNGNFDSALFFINQNGKLSLFNVSLFIKNIFSRGMINLINGSCQFENFKLSTQNLSNYLISADSSNLKMRNCYFFNNNFIFNNPNLSALIMNIGSGAISFFENVNFVKNYMNVITIAFTGHNHLITMKSIFGAYNHEFSLSFTFLLYSFVVFENYFNVFKNQMSYY